MNDQNNQVSLFRPKSSSHCVGLPPRKPRKLLEEQKKVLAFFRR